MPTFRCYDCRHEFEVDGAKLSECPECGASGDSRIAKLEVIHFDPPAVEPSPDRPHIRRGKHHAACNEKLKVGRGARFSGETGAVTCEECKATEAFQAVAASGG